VRSRSIIVVPMIAVASLACSDDAQPGAIAPEPCLAQVVYELAAVSQATERDVRVAVLDAAERLAPALPDGGRAAELRAALRSVQAAGGPNASDAACRAIRIARGVLEAQPNAPESLPDREAIRHALDVAETYYARAR